MTTVAHDRGMHEDTHVDLPWGARLLPGVDLRLWLFLIIIALTVAVVIGGWLVTAR